MTTLIKAGAKPNDGSLHIASRKPDLECMRLLKSANHDVQWPAAIFDGRTPLAELCRGASGSGAKWAKTVQEAMELLQPLVDHSWRFQGGRTVLHLAIDNASAAVPVVRALLHVSRPWRSASRDDDYLFDDTAGTGFFYSPTNYVEILCQDKPADERQELVRLLRAARFADRYFAPLGADQPAGAVGLPVAQYEAGEAERLAARAHTRELRRAAELAALQARAAGELQEAALRHADERAERELGHARRAAEQRHDEERARDKADRARRVEDGDHSLELARRLAEQDAQLALRRAALLHDAEHAHDAELRRRELDHHGALAELRVGAQARISKLALEALRGRHKEEIKHAEAMGRTMANHAASAPVQQNVERQNSDGGVGLPGVGFSIGFGLDE